MVLIRRRPRLLNTRVPAAIRQLIRERSEWAAQEALAREGKGECDEQIVPWFIHAAEESDGERTVILPYDDGTLIRSTLVMPQSQHLDENMLRARIGEAAYKRLVTPVTVEHFDQDKLAQEIASGRIDPAVVDACTTTHEGTPYVRHTVRTGRRRRK